MSIVNGYIYENDGTHGGKLEFYGTPQNIANFIMYNQMNACVITDELDRFIVSSTVGGFLDRVCSPEMREAILKEILPLQLCEKEPVNPVKGELV